MRHQTMPFTRYVALHWAGGVGDSERIEILNWIKHQRERYYASAIPPRSIAMNPPADP